MLVVRWAELAGIQRRDAAATVGEFGHKCYRNEARKIKGVGEKKFGVRNAECGEWIVNSAQQAESGAWESKIPLFIGNRVCFGRVIIVFGNC